MTFFVLQIVFIFLTSSKIITIKLTKPRTNAMPTIRKKEPNKELVFKKRYKEFDDFYDENKPLIYKSIYELFTEFKDKRKKTVVLHLQAKIRDVDWDTTFTFHRDEHIVLKRDIMPFFESIEEFELCGEINNFYKDFTSK